MDISSSISEALRGKGNSVAATSSEGSLHTQVLLNINPMQTKDLPRDHLWCDHLPLDQLPVHP
eukprot:8002242-Prorocentrum_lima.AAC.1